MSFRNKLILYLCIGMAATYSGIGLYIQHSLKDRLVKKAILEMELIGEFMVSQIQNSVINVEEIIQNSANAFKVFPADEQQVVDLLEYMLESNQGEIAGSCFAYNPEDQINAPYFYADQSEIKFKNLADPNYQYTQSDWFKIAFENKKPQWSLSYFDTLGGEKNMITYSLPVQNTRQEYIGILTGDLSLNWLNNSVLNQKHLDTPYQMWIVQQNTQLIEAHVENKYILKKTVEDLYPNFIPNNQFNQEMHSKNNLLSFGEKDRMEFIMQIPLEFNNWEINLYFDKKEILKNLNQTLKVLQISFGIGLLILILVVTIISRRISDPIITLSNTIKNIGAGKFDNTIPYTERKDEIGIMALSFSKMQVNLKNYLKQLKQSIAENTRIQNELEVGKKIQHSLLPTYDTIKELTQYQISSYLKSAKEVGGDLYDFFEIGNGNICFVVGDVSGKGVPAALQMASVRSSLRAYARQGKQPEEILSLLNKDNTENNDLCMFITLFCAITDIDNKKIIYSNAGHEYPFVSTPDQAIIELKTPPQMALGVSEDAVYKDNEFSTEKYHRIFIYSDGLTDALNKENVSYGKDNIPALMKKTNSADDLVAACQEALEQHCFQAEAFDDITLLAIDFNF